MNTEAFQTILKESNGKPNKIRVDQDREFSNRSLKSWLESNNIEIKILFATRLIHFYCGLCVVDTKTSSKLGRARLV